MQQKNKLCVWSIVCEYIWNYNLVRIGLVIVEVNVTCTLEMCCPNIQLQPFVGWEKFYQESLQWYAKRVANIVCC